MHAQDDHIFKNEDAGIQMEIPAGWKAEPDGETLTITAPDSSISIVFWALGETSFDDAIKALDQELDKVLKHVKVTEPAKEDTLNGMRTVGESGTAEVDGVKLEWSLDLVKARKPVIVLAFAAPDAMEKHADQLVKFLKSIKRIPA